MSGSRNAPDATRVLYILGSGRNGSTLLAMILASAPHAITVGELHWLWDRGLVENRLCGCGRPTRDCPFWTDVLGKRSAIGRDEGKRIAALRDAALSGIQPFRLLSRNWRTRATRSQREFMSVVNDLYRHLALDTSIVIDSSKRPTYGLLLSRVEGLDVRVVHLVRDSRAVAYSWLRKKPNPDIPGGGYMKRHSALMTAAGWNIWNLLSEWFWWKSPDAYMRVRYEDLIAHPEKVVSSIAAFAGLDPSQYEFDDDNNTRVEPSHTMSGNPSRFAAGKVKLQPDDEWRIRMRSVDRWVTTFLTWPELLRYQYPLRTRHRHRDSR